MTKEKEEFKRNLEALHKEAVKKGIDVILIADTKEGACIAANGTGADLAAVATHAMKSHEGMALVFECAVMAHRHIKKKQPTPQMWNPKTAQA